VSYSTGTWIRDVRELLDSGQLGGRLPIFVGGTGLYFKALLGGLSEMPAVPTAIRLRWRERLAVEGPEALHALLLARDPSVAERLKPNDGQRILRALEVLDATGLSLAAFQASRGEAIFDPSKVRKIILAPDRASLRAVIATRFEAMVSGGAIPEVQALLARTLDPSLPAMKAIGVREIGDALAGKTSIDEAMALAVTATRQYAKRQSTWFRNQFGSDWGRWEKRQ
jgi:tRNA dimethylallyltransferase